MAIKSATPAFTSLRAAIRHAVMLASVVLASSQCRDPDGGVTETLSIRPAHGDPYLSVGDTGTFIGEVGYLLSVAPSGPIETSTSARVLSTIAEPARLAAKFTSGDPKIATVDSLTGLVHAISVGITNIVGIDNLGRGSASAMIVTPRVSRLRIVFDRPLPLNAGDVVTLTVTALDSLGAPVPGIPIAVSEDDRSVLDLTQVANESGASATTRIKVLKRGNGRMRIYRWYMNPSGFMMDTVYVTTP